MSRNKQGDVLPLRSGSLIPVTRISFPGQLVTGFCLLNVTDSRLKRAGMTKKQSRSARSFVVKPSPFASLGQGYDARLIRTAPGLFLMKVVPAEFNASKMGFHTRWCRVFIGWLKHAPDHFISTSLARMKKCNSHHPLPGRMGLELKGRDRGGF